LEKFADVKKRSDRTPHMISMQNWVENYICGTQAGQNVVGNRRDNLGLPVSELMFKNGNRWTHVCPYVRDAVDYDQCWIEESPLDGSDPAQLENLLLEQLTTFKAAPPAHDPVAQNHQPAPLPILWKNFITFFPRIVRQPRTGPFALMDDVQAKLLPLFIQNGLLFGAFYPGCPTTGIHNDQWNKAFVCPFAAFVVRYLAQHDHQFIGVNSPNRAAYRSYFPCHS
jgi:hypothetical protein